MPISKKEQEKIRTRVKERVKNWKCESCGSTSWTFSNYYLPTSVSENPSQKNGVNQLQPLINITCSKCGFVRFYNLIMLDLLDELKKEKQEEKKDNDQGKK